ncbi:hypothetical protein ACLOAV_004698 [Pseudogymnoascus australis]
MVFTPPASSPAMTDIPDTVSLPDFLLDNKYRSVPHEQAKNPFTCGLSGKTYTSLEWKDRTGWLARALHQELGFQVNQGTEWEKVIGIYTLNTIDTLAVSFAVHYLNGVASPANAAYSASELAYQLKSAGAKAIFTCIPLLENALQAAKTAGIPEKHVYILDMPDVFTGGKKVPFKTVGDLVEQGKRLPAIEPLRWTKGQGERQTAFLCYSSGTSGLPKGVMISHRNCITNVIQMTLHEQVGRAGKGPKGGPRQDVSLGLLPFSHIYGLVVICLAGLFRGDETIVLPKFELATFLQAIQEYKISVLYIVPPIVIGLINAHQTASRYDLTSVESIFTGAAPLGESTAGDLAKLHPTWRIRQGYGMTETCTVVCSTTEEDVWFGSSGPLLPGFTVKIVRPDGSEVTAHNEEGELLVQSHSVVLGYLNNPAANAETFLPDTDGKGRWIRTGDVAIVSVAPSGNEHITITERIKELIKVNGHQVAPAELEALLLSHPSVADAAVIPVPSDRAGEVPRAYVVKSTSVSIEENDKIVKRDIAKSALQAILVPIVTLSVANPAANSSLSSLEATFVVGLFSDQPQTVSTISAVGVIADVAFVLPGNRILIFPIGGIITGAWAVMFIGVIEWGAVGRMGFRENYRRRLMMADRGGEKTIQRNDNDGMHGIMLDSLITPTRHSLDNSTAESQGGDKRLRVGGSSARRASDESPSPFAPLQASPSCQPLQSYQLPMGLGGKGSALYLMKHRRMSINPSVICAKPFYEVCETVTNARKQLPAGLGGIAIITSPSRTLPSLLRPTAAALLPPPPPSCHRRCRPATVGTLSLS